MKHTIILGTFGLAVALCAAACSSTTGYEQPVAGAQYEVLELKDYQSRASVRQDSPESCWAACVESIQKYSGRSSESQAQIAARIRGTAEASRTDAGELSDDPHQKDVAIRAAGQLAIMRALAPDAKIGGLPDWRKLNKLFYSTVKVKESYVDPLTSKMHTVTVEERSIRWDTIAGTSMNVASVVADLNQTGADQLVAAIESGEPAVAGFSAESQNGPFGHLVVVCGVERRDTSNPGLGVAQKILPHVGVKSPEIKKSYALTRIIKMDPAVGTVDSESAQKFAASVEFILTAASSKSTLEKLYHLLPEE